MVIVRRIFQQEVMVGFRPPTEIANEKLRASYLGHVSSRSTLTDGSGDEIYITVSYLIARFESSNFLTLDSGIFGNLSPESESVNQDQVRSSEKIWDRGIELVRSILPTPKKISISPLRGMICFYMFEGVHRCVWNHKFGKYGNRVHTPLHI